MAARPTNLRRALALSAFSIAWSGVVGSIAIWAALASGSLSLLGFGADALIDASASAALVWRFAVEARQPERAARVERAAERVVGWALVVLAVYLIASSVRSLAVQSHPEVSTASLVLLVASAAVLPPLALTKYRVAAQLGSGALRADSLLTAAAALLALISLASLVTTDALGFWWADAVGALIVGAVILREGWSSLALARSAS
jgi:divalent metal cation (Fe/Co/Zn/Cd) transporter